jgi:hypothetical protein
MTKQCNKDMNTFARCPFYYAGWCNSEKLKGMKNCEQNKQKHNKGTKK